MSARPYLVKVWDTQQDSTRSFGNSGRSNIARWWVDDTLLVCVLQDYAGNYSQEIYLHNARTGDTTLLAPVSQGIIAWWE